MKNILAIAAHPDDIERLTPEHKPASCQPDGAIESGNIQEFLFQRGALKKMSIFLLKNTK